MQRFQVRVAYVKGVCSRFTGNKSIDVDELTTFLNNENIAAAVKGSSTTDEKETSEISTNAVIRYALKHALADMKKKKELASLSVEDLMVHVLSLCPTCISWRPQAEACL